jgi:hypothetical protein
VPHSGPQPVRGHLRLASAPASPTRSDRRILLVARAFLVAFAVAWLTALAWLAAVAALLPLVWRREPLGRRLRPPVPRVARIIPFQPRRRALPH